MAVSVLAGCGNNAGTETAEPAAATEEEIQEGTAEAIEAEGAFEGTAKLVIDYAQAVDPKGEDIVNGAFQATPEERGALATQMIGTENQFAGMNIGFHSTGLRDQSGMNSLLISHRRRRIIWE